MEYNKSIFSNQLKEILGEDKVQMDEPMSKHTTFRIGGPAEWFVFVHKIEELQKVTMLCKEWEVPYYVVGNGSDLLVSDTGVSGVIIRLAGDFETIEIEEIVPEGTGYICVGAGTMLSSLALRAGKKGFTGLEFASGIPGTVGGAVFMNAGAYKSDMGYIVTEIKVLTPNLEVKTMYNKELDFHYRTSFLQKNRDYICLEATIQLYKGKKEAIMNVIRDRKLRRLESQPLEYPSAGSVFRNPEGDFAGRLIEEVGYKGKQVGGAMVSTKHANFIINVGGATGQDIKKLITDIQEKIKKEYKIELKVEQEFVE